MFHEEVDVLIIGSGPVGSTFARVIADHAVGARILMIEAGPVLSARRGEHVQNLPATERPRARRLSQGPDADADHVEPPFYQVARGVRSGADPALFQRSGLFLAHRGPDVRAHGEFGLPAASMSSGVGGMGVHWTASVPRPSGVERIGFIPHAELEAAYTEADRLLRVSRDLDGGDPLLAKVLELVAGAFDTGIVDAPPVQLTPFAVTNDARGTRFSGTDVILGDLSEADTADFELRAQTVARRVLLDASGGRAVGALLLDRRTDAQYAVRASQVVVAADALRTPQLLYASGIRPPALGRYLNDHLKVVGAFRLDPRFSSEIPQLEAGPRPLGAVLIPYIDEVRPIQGQIHLASRSPIAVTSDEYAARDALQPDAALAWYGAKELRHEDAIEFSDTESDTYGLPNMLLRYGLTDADCSTVGRMREDAIKAARLLGELVVGEPQLMPGGSSLHYQGSTRMGAFDDGASVCDSYARVWGVDGLYLGGNNVIPTSTACNPTITSVALAVRSAGHLVHEAGR
ncbi:GMC oxidoreductase [Kribbella sp. NPDC055071]